MGLTILLLLVFFTAAFTGYAVIPGIYNRASLINERRQQRISNNMEKLMPMQEAKKMSRLFVSAPIIFAAVFYFVMPEEFRLFGIVLGLFLGFALPSFYVNFLSKRAKDRFSDQLIDALMIMSSSFRGGLSLVQAFEAVVEEMPDPINKEFGTVLGENKMGVSLEEALNHLYSRMPSTALQQMTTAILLARETGGNLPAIFNRIVTNIRESKKIQQNLDTLTIQGKIQGAVMSLLPIGFVFIVYSSNRRIFDNMLVSQVGRGMLMYATFSWLIGVYLIWKISTFKEF